MVLDSTYYTSACEMSKELIVHLLSAVHLVKSYTSACGMSKEFIAHLP